MAPSSGGDASPPSVTPLRPASLSIHLPTDTDLVTEAISTLSFSDAALSAFHSALPAAPDTPQILSQVAINTSELKRGQVQLKSLTCKLVETFKKCNPEFTFVEESKPRRVLSKNPDAVKNDGHDNSDDDYVLYVNDILGSGENQYIIMDLLGQGTFGQVVSCISQPSNQQVAVKVIKNQTPYYNQALVEINILEKLGPVSDRGHLVKLIDHFTHHNHLCLVFELLGISLLDLIVQNQYRGFSTNLIRVITRQLLESLVVLEEQHIIHCDLKPENVLFENVKEARIKVIDFGSSCYFGRTVYSYIQSRFYRSPEVLLGLSYGSTIDMWSLGCIAAELFLGIPLFPGSSAFNQLCRIVDMIGSPPSYMLAGGKFTRKFFVEERSRNYRLKSDIEYAQENGIPYSAPKTYFAAKTLAELIENYPLKKTLSAEEAEKERAGRRAFTDFLTGVLCIDPSARWKPSQAREHPFITGKEFTGPFQPSPPEKPKKPHSLAVKDLNFHDASVTSPHVGAKVIPAAQRSDPRAIPTGAGRGIAAAQQGSSSGMALSLGASPTTNPSFYSDHNHPSQRGSWQQRFFGTNPNYSPQSSSVRSRLTFDQPASFSAMDTPSTERRFVYDPETDLLDHLSPASQVSQPSASMGFFHPNYADMNSSFEDNPYQTNQAQYPAMHPQASFSYGAQEYGSSYTNQDAARFMMQYNQPSAQQQMHFFNHPQHGYYQNPPFYNQFPPMFESPHSHQSHLEASLNHPSLFDSPHNPMQNTTAHGGHTQHGSGFGPNQATPGGRNPHGVVGGGADKTRKGWSDSKAPAAGSTHNTPHASGAARASNNRTKHGPWDVSAAEASQNTTSTPSRQTAPPDPSTPASQSNSVEQGTHTPQHQTQNWQQRRDSQRSQRSERSYSGSRVSHLQAQANSAQHRSRVSDQSGGNSESAQATSMAHDPPPGFESMDRQQIVENRRRAHSFGGRGGSGGQGRGRGRGLNFPANDPA
eukprot:TRINITY_DN13189_c0_g1_i1.p1 TRINITY_DN13189_c0_g1~~TRINITY_DN13189_c0_g1_i1.p1  ORF type:complete len:984 (-),score=170.12 TRINITY_DN13189_c0_g1_i1:881-3832(-)